MLVQWMLYAVAVTLVVGIAARLTEGALRALDRPTRWVWLGAAVGAVALPAVMGWIAPRAAVIGTLPVPSVPIFMEGLTVGASAAPGPDVVAVLIGAWAAASALLLLFFGHAWIRLRAWRSEWEVSVVDGETVFLSRATGPAVVGIWPGRIVLPRWILDLDERERRMILAHEIEHRRAGDPLLLLLASLPVVAFPWNPVLWWIRSRLRAAVEIDCDQRVMGRSGRDRRGYGELLLDVGRRSRVPAAAFPGFAERPSLLERRLVALTRRGPERPLRRAGYLLAGAAALFFIACGIPTPDAMTGPELGEDEERIAPVRVGDEEARVTGLQEQPTFTPYTVKPELTNVEEVRAALDEEYPPLLREAGVGGTTVVWFFIDAEGRVQQNRVAQSSGHAAIDEAALRVAAMIEFTPARNRDERVPVWVQFPITFQVR